MTLSSAGEEVTYQYDTLFRSLEKGDTLSKEAATEAAAFHASHLFGLFHSPEVAQANGYSPDLIDGFAGTQKPQVSRAEAFRRAGDAYLWVRYHGRGRMVVLKPVLKHWLGDTQTAGVDLPLLEDLPAIYSDDRLEYHSQEWVKCTDEHYATPVDFSYFYAPYRCPALGQAPIAADVRFTVTLVNAPEEADQHLVPLARIQGDNQNGALTVLYFVSGFDETPRAGASTKKIHKNWGWKTFASVEELLVGKYGFEKMESLGHLRETLGENFETLSLLTPVTMVHDLQRRYFSTFVKVADDQLFVVRSALFNTDNEARSEPLRSFPKFWKEAWENADVLYFGGHSGDGQALSLETLLDTLDQLDIDEIQFNRKKTQIALLDSCSSYAHYQDLYFKLLPTSLHLITYGLVSLFHLAPSTIDQLLKLTLGDAGREIPWVQALGQIERGQLPAHVNYLMEEFTEEERASTIKKFARKKMYPTSLINVRVPGKG